MRDAFLLHGFPLVEQDPNKQEYSLDNRSVTFILPRELVAP